MREKNKIAIYGCGGMGINACNKVINIPSTATGFPEVIFTLLDTSESNLAEGNKEMNTYLIPGLDGSGKDRKFSHGQAAPHVDKILTKYQPQDFNIIIFSLAGGSGSTIGPLLARELIDRGEPVFLFCVGNGDSGKEAQNSLNTIATLQGISKKLNKPIAAKFYINDAEHSRTSVDRQIENDVRALALLLSGLNDELDNEDIQNFLYFNKVTPIEAQLVDLIIYSKDENSEDPSGFTAIAVASALPSYDDVRLNLGQPYGCAGYMPSGVTEASSDGIKPLHFILTNGFMNGRLENYRKVVTTFEEARERLENTTILTVEGNSDEDGFVF